MLTRFIALAIALFLVACGSSSSPLFEPSSSGTGASPATSSGTGSASAVLCTPGAQVACACPGGGQGAQACDADGTGYGPCEGCETASSSSSSSSSSSGASSSSSSTSSSTSSSSSSSSGAPGYTMYGCELDHVLSACEAYQMCGAVTGEQWPAGTLLLKNCVFPAGPSPTGYANCAAASCNPPNWRWCGLPDGVDFVDCPPGMPYCGPPGCP